MRSGPITAADIRLTPLSAFLPDIVISIPRQSRRAVSLFLLDVTFSLVKVKTKKVTITQIYIFLG